MIDNITQEKHEPFLSQTLESNGRQYNNQTTNHSSIKPQTVMIYNITTTALQTISLLNIKQ
jgi:hypothetical protein